MKAISNNVKHFTQVSNKIGLLVLFTLVLLILNLPILANDTKTESEIVGYDFYTSPNKIGYVALGIRANPVPSSAAHEVVFLVDTSASQAGQTKEDTINTLKATINNLPENASVQILAMDVDTTALTPSFVGKNSTELADALKKLQRRVPLGATDLRKGVEAARNTFDSQNNTASKRAVVYLGDGRSMAKSFDMPVFVQEIRNYVDQKIPFTACTISPLSNVGLVAAFANQTGGNLINFAANVKNAIENANQTAYEQKLTGVDLPNFSIITGKQLSDAVTATVVWVDQSSYSFPDSWEMFPPNLQPIRSDRETFILARTDPADLKPFQLKVNGETVDGEVNLSWQIAPNKNQMLSDGKIIQNGKQFLAGLVESAARDDGRTLPIVGRDSFNVMQDAFLENIDTQLEKAKVSLETGNPKQAMPILENVLKLDPGNRVAVRYLEVARHDDTTNTVTFAGDSDPVAILNNKNENNTTTTSSAKLPTMVDASIIERSITADKVQNEVRVLINKAATTMTNDPVGTEQNIRLMMTSIRENPTLEPNHRNMLLDRLGNVLRQTENEKFKSEMRSTQLHERQYIEQVKIENINAIEESDARAIQIFNRFNALMNAAEYRTATTVAETAMSMLPELTAPSAAHRLAMMTSYIVEYNELRHKRHVGFIESYMVLERSFVPIPEEPPVTYIDPVQWLILKDRRKKRYEVSDLKAVSPAEQLLRDALDKSIDITVGTSEADNTLAALIDQIKRQTSDKINIRIDPTLTDVGVTSSTTIASEPVSYQGVKCRNVLKSLLGSIPGDISFCIADEVLLITDAEKAKKQMTSKVYPIGDLAVSPEPIGGMGMGMMGGMMGGMGGYGGGMMGGMGGYGGYGGGMMGGMGGYGGGMMGGYGGGMGGYGGGMMGGYGGGMGGYGGGMYSVSDDINRNNIRNDKKTVDKKNENNANTENNIDQNDGQFDRGFMSVPSENIRRANNTNSKNTITNPISVTKNQTTTNNNKNVNRESVVRENSLPATSSTSTKKPRVVTGDGWSRAIASQPISLPQRGVEVVKRARAADDLAAFWDSFFLDKSVDENYIREIVEIFKSDFSHLNPKEKRVKAAEQLVCFIESAILADKVSPWMYEVLALSLYVKGAPKAELERAILSAADFCNNVEDLMHVAMFLQTIGLPDRAFTLFWAALESASPQFEYYAAAFRLAESLYLRDHKYLTEQEIKSSENALCLASLAIISMEWDGANGEKLIQRANDAIDTLIAKMRKNERFTEADMLAQSVYDARLRDCVVTVEWTGNAGVSISVIEPTGSCCWFLNPRTLSGGTLKSSLSKGDGTLTERSNKRHVSYICPRGFNGTYQVVVHKDWGNLVNGSVNIKVDTSVAAGQSFSINADDVNKDSNVLKTDNNGYFKAYQIKDGGIIVTFDLSEGRRLEQIEQAKLNVASIRANVARKALTQFNVLRRLENDSVLAQVVANTGGRYSSDNNSDTAPVSVIRTSNNRNNGNAGLGGQILGRANRYIPVFGQSVIGYRPEITLLQEGTQLMSNAVISADRCYVRLSPSPSFTDIREVFKYNMANGEGGISGSTNISNTGGGGLSNSGYGNNNSYGGGSYGYGGGYGGGNYGGYGGGGYY
ncbi:MAG: VWA domain-containing protein [Planctomycetaceae bacterium]|jgi:tetratricopeptide (TPR) repeat protein|nr:VWA domain-containing protein [Planctomycetaceae bacterium]